MGIGGFFCTAIVCGIFFYVTYQRSKTTPAKEGSRKSLLAPERDTANSDLRHTSPGISRDNSDPPSHDNGPTEIEEAAPPMDSNAPDLSKQNAVASHAAALKRTVEAQARLSHLQFLHEYGFIDDDEFARRKLEISKGL